LEVPICVNLWTEMRIDPDGNQYGGGHPDTRLRVFTGSV